MRVPVPRHFYPGKATKFNNVFGSCVENSDFWKKFHLPCSIFQPALHYGYLSSKSHYKRWSIPFKTAFQHESRHETRVNDNALSLFHSNQPDC